MGRAEVWEVPLPFPMCVGRSRWGSPAAEPQPGPALPSPALLGFPLKFLLTPPVTHRALWIWVWFQWLWSLPAAWSIPAAKPEHPSWAPATPLQWLEDQPCHPWAIRDFRHFMSSSAVRWKNHGYPPLRESGEKECVICPDFYSRLLLL